MSLIDKASLIQIPSGYKSTKLYSIEPTNGDGDFTFSRSSSGTRVNSEGLIETASVLGSELVTNGDFATDTDWTINDWSISGGSLNGSASTGIVFQNPSGVVVGKTYKVTLEVKSYTSGSIRIKFGGSSYSNVASQVGVQEFYIQAVSTGGFLISVISSFTGSISSVSVKEVFENDVPRLDYSGGASCASLLLEPQRTNVYLNSEPISNEGPAGNISYVNTSFGLGFNNYTYYLDNSVDRYRYGGTCVATTEYTLSVFVIMDDNSSPNVSASSSSGDFSIIIANAPATSISVTHYGNNIYRVIAKRTSGSSNLGNNGIVKYTGQSSVGFKAVGWQLEAGSYPTSYIPTSGSTVTRTADVCNNAGTSATFNDSEGVLFFEGALLDVSENDKRISISDGSSLENRILLRYLDDNQLQVELGYTSGFSEILNLSSTSDYNKIAVVYDSTNASVFINGVKLVTNTMSALNGLSQLQFQRYAATSKEFVGKTKQLIYFDEALSDEELATLTTL